VREAGLCSSRCYAGSAIYLYVPRVKERDAKASRLELHALRGEIKCPTCGAHAPEGLLHHDCGNPSPQPSAAELLDDE
jgi:hypothetical protein